MADGGETVQPYESTRGHALLGAILYFVAALLLVVLAGVLLASAPLLSSIESDEKFFDMVFAVQTVEGESAPLVHALWALLEAWIEGIATIFTITAYSALAIASVGFVMFLLWVYRAHRNLPALGAGDLKFKPMAVLWWLVPGVQLYLPFQLISEIWRHSDPAGARAGPHRPDPSRAPLRWWWLLFVLTMLLEYVWVASFVFGLDLSGGLSTMAQLWLGVILDIMLGLLCFFTALVLLTIDGMQVGRHRVVEAMRKQAEG